MKRFYHLYKSNVLIMLMSASELLLMAFVFWWLHTQFEQEKSVLRKDLSVPFSKSRQRVIDSVLVKNLIAPVLHREKKDSVAVRLTAHEESDSLIIVRHFTGGDSISENGEAGGDILPFPSDSAVDHRVFVHHLNKGNDSLLMHGVKLIVKEVAGAFPDKHHLDNLIASQSDTALLKIAFKENLQAANFDFATHWIRDYPQNESESGDNGIYLESDLFKDPFGVLVSAYDGFLYQRILPQILFAIVLLSLTAIAFLLAYQSLKKEKRLSMLKDDFISNISHELKTPLSTVKVAIEAVQQLPADGKDNISKEYLSMASREVQRLELLVGKILTTAVMEYQGDETKKEKLALGTFLAETINSMELRFADEKADLQYQPPAKEIFATVNRFRLQSVLLNLFDNALKYGGQQPVIEVELSENDTSAFVKIADNGPGIPEIYSNRIFDKFFRVPSGNLHAVKGHGLGLSFAKEIMKQHKGDIRMKNRPGGGCEFLLTFPKYIS